MACIRPFQILYFEPMALILDLYSALLLGILYLFFGAFPLVFMNNHGFNCGRSVSASWAYSSPWYSPSAARPSSIGNATGWRRSGDARRAASHRQNPKINCPPSLSELR